MNTVAWLLQIAGLCIVPCSLMAGLSQGRLDAEFLPTLQLRLLGLGAGCFLLGRFLYRRTP